MRIIGNAGKAREVQAVASGALPNGKPVVINADGTVSVISATGGGAATGTPVIYEAADTQTIAATFDSNNNKVVLVYMDNGNSSLCTAIVGTVSGTSISFGTPATFGVVAQNTSVTFDSNSNKVVIVYRDTGNNNYGTAIVGTVSGTSISFGTSVVFESAASYSTEATFDENSNKVVIAYRDLGNSSYGTAVVGTVSGTSISFGTPVVFETSNVYYMTPVYDGNSQKIIIPYRDVSNNNYCTAIVGTVSGTSISFGSAVVFHSVVTSFMWATFDSSNNKVVIAYRNNNNSSYGTAIVGTVSGTSISFGTPVVFNTNDSQDINATFDSSTNKVVITYKDVGATDPAKVITGTVSGTSISFDTPTSAFGTSAAEIMRTAFDSNTNSVVIAYKDNSNSNQGTAVVFKTASTNLTSDNYIGTAATGAPSGQGAKINIKGAVADIPAAYYDIANASYDDVSFDVSGQDTNPRTLAFNNSGTKMYIVGRTNDTVYQYSLSTAFNVGTASYDSVSFSVASQDNDPLCISFNNDGTKFYIVGNQTDTIYQYSLSSAFDMSTASYDSVSFSVSSQDAFPDGMAFNNDGSKVYVVGDGTDTVYQYSLSTEFDLSTASYDSVSFDASGQDSSGRSVAFNSDGTKMFITGATTDTVYQYSLSTAFSVGTASYDSVSFSFASQDSAPFEMVFTPDGTKMYIVGNTTDTVYQYSTSVSLTAGQSYYVQTDGTLGTTPADPSVFAGTAVAANKLIVKG